MSPKRRGRSAAAANRSEPDAVPGGLGGVVVGLGHATDASRDVHPILGVRYAGDRVGALSFELPVGPDGSSSSPHRKVIVVRLHMAGGAGPAVSLERLAEEQIGADRQLFVEPVEDQRSVAFLGRNALGEQPARGGLLGYASKG